MTANWAKDSKVRRRFDGICLTKPGTPQPSIAASNKIASSDRLSIVLESRSKITGGGRVFPSGAEIVRKM